MEQARKPASIAVVIPCYKVKRHVLEVIAAIGPECCKIYAVDDCCPQDSGAYIVTECLDKRVQVLRTAENLGVGGAVMTGYRAALADGIDIVVKIDGDGQMDPTLLADFVAPILAGEADYTKGNRFFDLEALRSMPNVRLFGNALLSFLTKLSSGYWNLFDPTNGYTAIHRAALQRLPLHKISQRYFFESDMLFRMNILRAVVVDVPMTARYGDETSSLVVSRVAGEFLGKNLRNFCKRLFYNYYLRDMSPASIELPLGLGLLLFGTLYGGFQWAQAAAAGVATPAGTVMLAALPVLMGLQLLLGFLHIDINSVPTRPLQRSSRQISTPLEHKA